MPVIATKSDVVFPYIRNVDCRCDTTKALMHHVSWSSPKDVYKKVTCYAHAIDFNGKEWYEKNYVNWKFGEEAILPDREYDVIKQVLPGELYRCYTMK